MVQTSLAAWLKKPLSKNDDVVHKKINTTAEQHTQPALRVQDARQIRAQKPQDGETLEKIREPKSLTQKRLSLPSSATLSAITVDTLPSFRRMTALLLPVPYPDKFYSDILNDEVAGSISMVALWTDKTRTPTQEPAANDRVVSGIRCRLLASSPGGNNDDPSLYISTVTTLAPFRGHGLASALLQCVTARAIREYSIGTVTAHMWEANEDARQWYEKQGFKEIQYDAKYYRKLKPGGAYLLEKRIGPHDLLGIGEDHED